MRYIGRLSGEGMLRLKGADIARTSFDFDIFCNTFKKMMTVMSSGEIRLPAATIKTLLGRGDVQLLTDEGRLLDLKFTDKATEVGTNVAHVDVSGNLPQTLAQLRA